MVNPLIYILLNGELNMSPGKAAAQSAHAVAALSTNEDMPKFTQSVQRTVIVLEADNQQQLDNLKTYLTLINVPSARYIDEGHNEVAPYSVTALAVGPMYSDESEIRELLQPFPLYPKKKGWFK